MSKKSVALNYIYNVSIQIFTLITPLITTPYISRVLSAEGVGKFSFTLSIDTYFVMLTSLGFALYAQRKIAFYQSNEKEQSRVLWEIILCKSITGFATLVLLWSLIAFGVFGQYETLMKILSIEILAAIFNISFFFQGNEQFGLIALRDFIFKLIGIALIFLFVKKPGDLWIYALSHSGTSLLSTFSLWLCLKKENFTISVRQLHPMRHFLPSLKLFIPTIAISLFTILDKTLIGVLIPGNTELVLADGTVSAVRLADVENGYYAQAEKITRLSMLVLASLGTVMLPRNTKVLEEGHEDIFLQNIHKAMAFVFFIGSPITAGLIAVASNFSPWFFGPGYGKVSSLLRIFAFMALPAGIGNVIGQQYLLPKGEDNRYIITYVMTGLLNVCLNILMIPRLLSYGAAIASVIAETFAPLVMFMFVREKLSFLQILKENWKPLVASAFMCSGVLLSSLALTPTALHTLLLIVEGIVLYVGFALALRCEQVPEAFAIAKNILKRR